MTSTLLRGIVGSHAYGLNHADSDTDRMGVFVAPTLEVAGLNWHASSETRVSQGPGQDDWSEHEVGKFLKLALKVNPTVSELLWLNPDGGYEVFTDEGHQLRALRYVVLSRRAVVGAYKGYAGAQLKKYQDGFTKVKYARHCLRLLDQGYRLYRDGILRVKVDNPQKYFDLADMTSDQVLEVLNRAMTRWEDYTGTTPLPEEPDVETVRYVLNHIRKNHLEG